MMNTTNGYLGACLTYSQDLDNEEQRAREPDRRDAGAKLFLVLLVRQILVHFPYFKDASLIREFLWEAEV